MPYDPAVAREIDREVQDNARAIAQAGVELAKRLGMDAHELLVQDRSSQPAQAILAAAAEHHAAAIVLGSRGHRGLRSKLLGSTSKGVLEGAGATPVLIAHEADDS
jgi:nucleotide-binding universal stress UspA family protein